MKKQHIRRLQADFPSLYPRPAQWACGDGWFDLVYELSAKLARIPGTEITGIKQKYGELRIDMRGHDAMADQLILEAEERSATICELCGRPGRTIQTSALLKTLCDAHEKRLTYEAPSLQRPSPGI